MIYNPADLSCAKTGRPVPTPMGDSPASASTGGPGQTAPSTSTTARAPPASTVPPASTALAPSTAGVRPARLVRYYALFSHMRFFEKPSTGVWTFLNIVSIDFDLTLATLTRRGIIFLTHYS